jgi:phage/plasmid-like protein (TIGR03299 family)
MAHALDFTTGKPAIAYVGETPWHGYGTKLEPGMDIDVWAKAAGLDWTAIKTQGYFKIDMPDGEEDKPVYIPATDKFYIVRDDTFNVLGQFTGRYQPVQAKEILEFFRDFILLDDRFQLETAGALKGGAVIWALAKYQEEGTVLGEKHTQYVLLTTSFDGSLATTAQATMIRVVCNNTLTASVFDPKAATIKIRHNKLWTPSVAEEAHDKLTAVAESFDAYKGMAETLAAIRMSKIQTEEFFKTLLFGNKKEDEIKTRGMTNFTNLMEAFGETIHEGTDANSAWTAFNAVTRYVDHGRSTRRTNGDESAEVARMSSAWFGSGAALKGKALTGLMELA